MLCTKAEHEGLNLQHAAVLFWNTFQRKHKRQRFTFLWMNRHKRRTCKLLQKSSCSIVWHSHIVMQYIKYNSPLAKMKEQPFYTMWTLARNAPLTSGVLIGGSACCSHMISPNDVIEKNWWEMLWKHGRKLHFWGHSVQVPWQHFSSFRTSCSYFSFFQTSGATVYHHCLADHKVDLSNEVTALVIFLGLFFTWKVQNLVQHVHSSQLGHELRVAMRIPISANVHTYARMCMHVGMSTCTSPTCT